MGDFKEAFLKGLLDALKGTSYYYNNTEEGIANLLESAEEAYESDDQTRSVKDLLYYQIQLQALIATLLNERNEHDNVYEKKKR